MAIVMIVIRIVIIIVGTKTLSRKSTPYYNPEKSSGKNNAKRYFRHILQHSVPIESLLSEYFCNSFLSVKGLMGLFCQSV